MNIHDGTAHIGISIEEKGKSFAPKSDSKWRACLGDDILQYDSGHSTSLHKVSNWQLCSSALAASFYTVNI
jgi:hypothetical protein